MHAMHVHRRILQQRDLFNRVRSNQWHMHTLLRWHGLRRRERCARGVRARQLLVARCDVVGVQGMRGWRSVRPLRCRYILQARR